MRDTLFSGSSRYPTITVDDSDCPDEYFLELTHSKVTDTVYIMQNCRGLRLTSEGMVTIDKKGAAEVIEFLQEFING
jgi:hypothetical protein